MPAIVLATLNARWQHASLGLRCLLANLGPLRPQAALTEFTIATPPDQVVERLLALSPRVVGLGVYIWNVEATTRVVAMLRAVAPDVKIVLGGPEVSHETDAQPIVAMADHVVTGPGEAAFARLAQALLHGPRPLARIVAGDELPPEALAMPYGEYDATDLADRHVYLEASRGCPYRCEFCLSALDRTARPFPLPALLAELERLHARGLRRFRFVDRTFNLRVDASLAILEFFLDRLERDPADPCFAHFEMVPDHLPQRLRAAVERFPAGTLQLEIGIQTWNPAVQATISRRQDDARAEDNLRWLRSQTRAHLHVDLIAGLPGEGLASFGAGFDRLAALDPHEIQVGLLKRLRGAPIARHAQAFGLRFSPHPPYEVLATDALPFGELQRLRRFARYWDLVGNSGRFPRTRPLLLADAPFERFLALSDALWSRTGQTHALAAERLHGLLRDWLVDAGGVPADAAEHALAEDWLASGGRGRLPFPAADSGADRPRPRALAVSGSGAPTRQARHLAAAGEGLNRRPGPPLRAPTAARPR